MGFKKDFAWGTATAAYQIEGAYNEDGKGLNDLDVEYLNSDKENAAIACDHYHRLEEDLDLLAELGVNSYRFSISWARIMPTGEGEINQRGIAFYNRLIDGLLERNITPFMTLFHAEMPYELAKKGGFLNPEFPIIFESFAEVIAQNFGDRVKHFFTFNEIGNIVRGYFGSNQEFTKKEMLYAIHNILKAHGLAVRKLKEQANVKVGYVSCADVPYSVTETKEDFEHAYRGFFNLDKDYAQHAVKLYADPIFFGRYPDEYWELFSDIAPEITEEDMKIISTPVDFFAHNIYAGRLFHIDENGNTVWHIKREAGATRTTMGWTVDPRAIYFCAKLLADRYKKPVYITECGVAFPDMIFSDGKVHDTLREEFIRTYLKELKRAADEGVDVAGFFYWSMMDNFEWAHGYTPRFGLIYVDYLNDLKRIPKDSFYTYKKIIENNGENL